MPKKKKQKTTDWVDIKMRFVVLRQSPAEIARDYGISAKTISNRAYDENWKTEKADIHFEIQDRVINRVADGIAEKYAEIYIQNEGLALEVISRHLSARDVPITATSQAACARMALRNKQESKGNDKPTVDILSVEAVSQMSEEDMIDYLLTGKAPETEEK